MREVHTFPSEASKFKGTNTQTILPTLKSKYYLYGEIVLLSKLCYSFKFVYACVSIRSVRQSSNKRCKGITCR